MKTSGNAILVTGGATGIGFALAEAFIKAGNQVLICGRRQFKLDEAKKNCPRYRSNNATFQIRKTGNLSAIG